MPVWALGGALSAFHSVNPSLAREIGRYGRFDAGGCENCGSCALVCELSKDGAPFPRRPIQYALVGLEDLLRGGLEPWLCHDCGDCSARCPRKADPRDSMASLRRWLVAQYDWTGLSARILTSRAWAAGSFLFAGALVFLLMVLYHLYVVGMSLGDLASRPMGMTHMFPTITYFTLAIVSLPLAILCSNALRMHRFVAGPRGGGKIPASAYVSGLSVLFRNMATQEGIAECPGEESRSRRAAHWLVALGVTLMLVLVVLFLRFFQTDDILPLSHPQRWLGYLATAFMLYGGGAMLAGRIGGKTPYDRHAGPGDYALPVLILLTAASGIAVHVLRYAELSFAAHCAYLAHLVVTAPLLLVEIPFGKCSHMLYRPLAIYFMEVGERARASPVPEVGKAA